MPDREKVIRGLERCSIGACAGKECLYYHDVMKDAITGCDCTTELVRDAFALLKEHEWISVGERLPKDDEDILAYFVADEESRIVPVNYAKGVWFDCVFNTVIAVKNITHWMPLPEPPKEGR